MLQQLRLSFSKNESQEIIKDIINAKASLMLVCTSQTSDKIIKFEISYDELKDLLANPISDSEIEKQTIENKLYIENSRCPLKLEEGLTETKASLVDNYIVFYYEVDEEQYNIRELKLQQQELKRNLEDYLKSMGNDMIMQNELRMLVNQNIGYQYRYYGNKSKEYVDIIFTPEELKKYISR